MKHLSSYISYRNTSNFVHCSIEFDRDCDYFAIAGVTKKIKVCVSSLYILTSFDEQAFSSLSLK